MASCRPRSAPGCPDGIVWVIIPFFGGGEKSPFEPLRDYVDAGSPVSSRTQTREGPAHESVTLPDPDFSNVACNATAPPTLIH